MRAFVSGVVLAILLHSTTALAEAATATAGCAEPLRALDLASWRNRVRGAKTGLEFAQALKELSFLRDASGQPLEPVSLEFLETRFQPETVKIDDFKVQLTPGGQPDHVIQVIAKGVPLVDESSSQKIFPWFRLAKVLRPTGPDAWCDLGMMISEPETIPESCPPYPGTTFSFEPLLDPRSKAIRTLRDFTLCNPGGKDEVQNRTLGYWAVIDGKLRKVFEQVLTETASNVFSGQQEESARVTLSGAFPKRIEVQSSATCRPGMAAGNSCVPDGEPGPNGPGTVERSKRTFTFDGKRYVEKSGRRSQRIHE